MSSTKQGSAQNRGIGPGSFIAVKVLPRSFNAIRTLCRTATGKKAQQLAHPNIVTVYDFDRDGSNVFMTMELLEGEPL